LFFKEKTTWKKIMMISIIIACLPSNNGFYCAIYLFPGLLFFLMQNGNRLLDYVYMLLFCVVFSPLQVTIHGNVVSWILANLAVMAIWLMLLGENVGSLLKQNRMKNCKKIVLS